MVMDENLQNMLLAPAALYIIALFALIFTISRPRPSFKDINRFANICLLGISVQCIHFIEEFLTDFHILLPQIFGLMPLSNEFFVTLNVSFIFFWILSVIGIRYNYNSAFFMIWFLALSMIVNLIAHPLLAIYQKGYFPGLFTSPIVGIIGVILVKNLFGATSDIKKTIV